MGKLTGDRIRRQILENKLEDINQQAFDRSKKRSAPLLVAEANLDPSVYTMLQVCLERVSGPYVVVVNVTAFLNFLGQLFLPLPSTLSSGQLFAMGIQWVSHGLGALVSTLENQSWVCKTDLDALIV